MLAPALTSSLADWLKPCHATSCSAVFPSCPFKQKENAVRMWWCFFFKISVQINVSKLAYYTSVVKKKNHVVYCAVCMCVLVADYGCGSMRARILQPFYTIYSTVFFFLISLQNILNWNVCVCVYVCVSPCLACPVHTLPEWALWWHHCFPPQLLCVMLSDRPGNSRSTFISIQRNVLNIYINRATC